MMGYPSCTLGSVPPIVVVLLLRIWTRLVDLNIVFICINLRDDYNIAAIYTPLAISSFNTE